MKRWWTRIDYIGLAVLAIFAFYIFWIWQRGEHDRTLRHQLVATWQGGEFAELDLNEDGSFSATINTGSWGILTPKVVHTIGTWTVSSEKNLVMTTTNSSLAGDSRVGLIKTEEVIQRYIAKLNHPPSESELTHLTSFDAKDDNGNVTNFTRLK